MKGWLVYDEGNVERNRAYIGFWMEAAKARGVDISVVLTKDISFGVRDNAPFLTVNGRNEKPDFAVMRAPAPMLSAQFEQMGVRAFNSSRVSRICNDKRLTHALFAGRLPMMDTAFLAPGQCVSPFPFPVVVKAASGCGGRGVSLAKNQEELCAAMAKVFPDGAVVQPLCDEPGKDLRLYVLGGRVRAAMLRESEDGDFRSNFGLGGRASRVELTDEIAKMAKIVLDELPMDLTGVDFIFHRGRPVFNEIEDAVGARMLYIYTDINIVQEYLSYILRCLREESGDAKQG